MKKTGPIKLLTVLASVFLMTAMIAGCGGQQESAAGSQQNGKKTLVAATEGMVRPVSYVDKDGNLTGYEPAVLKAIAKELGYDIKFEKTEFSSMFAGVDSGRYQMGFGSINKTPEREKKYYFTTITHYYEPAVFFVTKGLTDKHPIHSLADLGGLRTDSNSKGDSWQQFVESYNKKFPDNPIRISYSDDDWAHYYAQLNSGSIDIIKGVESRLKVYEEEYGFHFDYVNLPEDEVKQVRGLSDPNQYFFFPKTEEGKQMAADFDRAIKKLQADGTLSKLSEQYLGKDYSSEENYEKGRKGQL